SGRRPRAGCAAGRDRPARPAASRTSRAKRSASTWPQLRSRNRCVRRRARTAPRGQAGRRAATECPPARARGTRAPRGRFGRSTWRPSWAGTRYGVAVTVVDDDETTAVRDWELVRRVVAAAHHRILARVADDSTFHEPSFGVLSALLHAPDRRL